jgi:hypothetical protein
MRMRIFCIEPLQCKQDGGLQNFQTHACPPLLIPGLQRDRMQGYLQTFMLEQMRGVTGRADGVRASRLCQVSCFDRRGAGSSLLNKPQRIEQITRSMSGILSCPLTIKVGLFPGAMHITCSEDQKSRRKQCSWPHALSSERL